MSEVVDDMSGLPQLQPADFEGRRLRKEGRVLVFFFARWCPYCRAACEETGCIKGKESYKAYSVDVSADDNPLWDQLGIDVVPTLIGYENGEEIYRRRAIRMVGLKRQDFEAADEAIG